MFGSKPPRSVKGSLLVARLQYIKHLQLDWPAVRASLQTSSEGELQKLVRGKFTLEEFFSTPDHLLRSISTGGWYPVALYNGLVRAMSSQARIEKNLAVDKVCRDSGRFTAENHLKGIMAFVLGWGSVERTIGLVSNGWSSYFSEGEVRVIELVPGKAQIDVVIDYLIPEMQYITCGYFEKVLEKKGANNVDIRSTHTMEEGGTFKYFVTWKAD